MPVTRRHALRALLAGGLGAAGLAGYSVGYERRHVGVTRETVTIASLPAALEGVRIGLVTDLHYGSFTGDEIIAEVVESLRTEQPDLVLLAGDYVTWVDRASVTPCAEGLARIAAPHGVYAALGNHDPEGTVKAVFERRGIGVLRDEHTQRNVRGEPVSVGGLKYWSRTPGDLERTFRGSRGFPILIAHDPRRFVQAAAAGVPLVLSGHTHGGQVVLPGLGAPAATRFPVVHGLARRGGTTLFVSRGVGTVVLPVRFNCPPEVALLTLHAAPRG